MVKAVYPGSFDPVTLGHLDIIRRAAKVVDGLVIGILVNSAKKPLFTLEERVQLLEEVTKEFPNVTVKMFDGMAVEFARENDAHLIIRGLRAVTDFETEMQIAQTNHSIDPGIDTMFFTTSLEYAFLSSTIVKEVAYYGADISKFVPAAVLKAFEQKAKTNDAENQADKSLMD
ncbi:pantetheine-phosphate adenylyltransferase [Clostridium sp. AM58-1XD]|uniref:pantetheine-phosphate adenylyltransferase n=1 Tax=Clostridium sp. AM58-1XD TaxID=2292307 RepID=UPI000E50B055|nr:pantetheine-phosphate adenylyltransferase [Clostridium sp. AM58-1XD]RGY98688.1 pantetheine-phosphate adenylyltransferase [Clostridium sp. AM58-1XD]